MPARKTNAPVRETAKELLAENEDLRSRLRQIGELAASHDADYESDPQSRLDEIIEIAGFEEDEEDIDGEDEDGEEEDDEEDDDEDDDEDDE